MRPAAADRHSRACTCACFYRDAKRADLPATGGRIKAAVAGSVVGGGALRAVVVVLLVGAGVLKVRLFWFRCAAPRNQHPRIRSSPRRLKEACLRFGLSSPTWATNSAEQPSIYVAATFQKNITLSKKSRKSAYTSPFFAEVHVSQSAA